MINRFLFLVGCFNALLAVGQGNSILSKTGFGDLYNSNFQQNSSFAGLGASTASANFLNTKNPASYSQLQFATGEIGLFSSTNYYSNSNASGSSSYTNLGAFGLGFPLGNNMGIALGVQPSSKKNYELSYSDVIDADYEAEYIYSGEGGLSDFFLGWGGQKNGLSVGVNFKYSMGRITDGYKVIYSSKDFQNVRIQDFNNIHGFGLDGGLQYEISVKEDQFLRLGVSGTAYGTMNSTQYRKANYFTINSVLNNNNKAVDAEIHDDKNYFIDTELAPVKSTSPMPYKYHAGLTYGEKDHWNVSAEYSISNWDDVKTGSTTDYLSSNTIYLAGEIIPNSQALGKENYWKSVSYRAGFKYGTTPFAINGNQLSEYGMNIGFGMPLKKFKYETEKFGSYVFLTLGYMHRSASDASLLSEDYFNINFSVILNDKWFVKRKFN